jgi:hypothetical protein
MHNNSIVRPIAMALLSLNATLTLALGHPLANSLPTQSTDSVKTLTGTVTDSKCKGQIDRQAVSLSSCARQSTHWEGADYMLLVGDTIYLLEGHRDELEVRRRARHDCRTRQWEQCLGRFSIVGGKVELSPRSSRWATDAQWDTQARSLHRRTT